MLCKQSTVYIAQNQQLHPTYTTHLNSLSLPHTHTNTRSGTGIFPPATAAFVALFNALSATAKLWLATKAGGRVPRAALRVLLPAAGALFTVGECRAGLCVCMRGAHATQHTRPMCRRTCRLGS